MSPMSQRVTSPAPRPRLPSREVLEAAGIASLFGALVDGVVAAREHLSGKPTPDTFLAADRLLGVRPSDAVVLEDAVAGVTAALPAGSASSAASTVSATRLRCASTARTSSWKTYPSCWRRHDRSSRSRGGALVAA